MMEKITNTGAKWFFALILALAFVPAACAQGTAEATYKAKCAGCHGADGGANTPAAKSTGRSRFPVSRRAKRDGR